MSNDFEVGWSPHSHPHVIVGHKPKPLTACGKTLSGLQGNVYVEHTDHVLNLCAKCRRLA